MIIKLYLSNNPTSQLSTRETKVCDKCQHVSNTNGNGKAYVGTPYREEKRRKETDPYQRWVSCEVEHFDRSTTRGRDHEKKLLSWGCYWIPRLQHRWASFYCSLELSEGMDACLPYEDMLKMLFTAVMVWSACNILGKVVQADVITLCFM